VLVTEHLSESVPWRSLLTDLDGCGSSVEAQVCEAVAVFLVDLHRQGVYWGDCSLANLLFCRDGHDLQPFLVDAETAEVRPSLTTGQRRHDLQILQDNLAGGLLDVAAELHRPADVEAVARAVRGISRRYDEVWRALHAQPTLPFERRQDAVGVVARLNDLGYAVDELRLTSTAAGSGDVRLDAVVADRRHHATVLQQRTGLLVREGQAKVLLDDLRAHACAVPDVTERELVRSWLEEVLLPAIDGLRAVRPTSHDAVQDYCDLLLRAAGPTPSPWPLHQRSG
jgi:hypothetical protein